MFMETKREYTRRNKEGVAANKAGCSPIARQNSDRLYHSLLKKITTMLTNYIQSELKKLWINRTLKEANFHKSWSNYHAKNDK